MLQKARRHNSRQNDENDRKDGCTSEKKITTAVQKKHHSLAFLQLFVHEGIDSHFRTITVNFVSARFQPIRAAIITFLICN